MLGIQYTLLTLASTGARIFMLPRSKPYFSIGWGSSLDMANKAIHSFRRLTEAWIIRAMYLIIT
jgi:hypothetical protein